MRKSRYDREDAEEYLRRQWSPPPEKVVARTDVGQAFRSCLFWVVFAFFLLFMIGTLVGTK